MQKSHVFLSFNHKINAHTRYTYWQCLLLLIISTNIILPAIYAFIFLFFCIFRQLATSISVHTAVGSTFSHTIHTTYVFLSISRIFNIYILYVEAHSWTGLASVQKSIFFLIFFSLLFASIVLSNCFQRSWCFRTYYCSVLCCILYWV